jgi:hypothetical protein
MAFTSATATVSGNNIDYAFTWTGFTCSPSPSIYVYLVDVNRNSIITQLFAATTPSGSRSGTFTNVYKGEFRVQAYLFCTDPLFITETTTVDNSTVSTINPPTSGSPGGVPAPVTNNPNSNFGICIPTTGAVSMGTINVLLERERTFINTELSGNSNPAVPPSQFGLSFLPSTGTISKSRPNAISEFRGYCHVPALVNSTAFYSFVSNIDGDGTLNIDYWNTSNNIANIFINHNNPSSPESTAGSFTVVSGGYIEITVVNNSFGTIETFLSVNVNGSSIYNSGFTSDFALGFNFVANSGDSINIISEANSY